MMTRYEQQIPLSKGDTVRVVATVEQLARICINNDARMVLSTIGEIVGSFDEHDNYCAIRFVPYYSTYLIPKKWLKRVSK